MQSLASVATAHAVTVAEAITPPPPISRARDRFWRAAAIRQKVSTCKFSWQPTVDQSAAPVVPLRCYVTEYPDCNCRSAVLAQALPIRLRDRQRDEPDDCNAGRMQVFNRNEHGG